MLRQLINEHLSKTIKDKEDVAILFSGGMDSLSILLSCLDIGIRPTLYSFRLKSFVSEDCYACHDISAVYDLPLIDIIIDDTGVDRLIEDVKKVITDYRVYKKNRSSMYSSIHVCNTQDKRRTHIVRLMCR